MFIFIWTDTFCFYDSAVELENQKSKTCGTFMINFMIKDLNIWQIM